MNEIQINRPLPPLSSDISSEVKKQVIDYIIDQMNNRGSVLDYYLDSSIYDTFKSFIIDQMIFNNYEVFKDGEEILVSYNNENIIDEQDVIDYVENNSELEKYLEQLLMTFYYENVDINGVLTVALNQARQDKKDFEDDGENYGKWDIEYSVNRAIDNLSFSTYFSDVIYDNNFEEFIQKEFLKADIIKENKMYKYYLKKSLLREYPESKIISILQKWGIDLEKDREKANIARGLINRFDQIKGTLDQKIDPNDPDKDIVVIPKEIRNKDIKNIDLYSFEDLDKLIKSYPENIEKIKKEAVKRFVEKEQIDKQTVQSYVARFVNNIGNLKFGVQNGLEDQGLTKEEVLNFIPKKLQQRNAFLDPRNWTWEAFEQMLDALFPSQKKVEDGEENLASTNADKVYDKDGIEIYRGDEREKCISYNPVLPTTKRQKYGWCVTTIGSFMYDTYRFGDMSPTFYFVFDRSKTSSPEHATFDDQWHAFVIQVSADKTKYVVTGADNRGDNRVEGWEGVAKVVPAETWAKIKNLKDYFKPIDLSPKERARKLASGRNLTLDEFKELTEDEKKDYILGKGQKNQISRDILEILPKYKIQYEGRSTTLMNIAIDSGQDIPYNILSKYEPLAKRYAIVRSRHDIRGQKPIPLPFIKYLDEKAKEKYLKTFDDSVTFEYIERFFGEEAAKKHVEEYLKKLKFLPPGAIKYIDNPKLKTLFKLYTKLFKNWQYGNLTNISDEQLGNLVDNPNQSVTPVPLTQKDWSELTTEDRKNIIELTKKYTGNNEYDHLLYGAPYLIKDKEKYYALLPAGNNTEYPINEWVLMDENGKIVKSNISGDISLDDVPLEYGSINDTTFNRVFDIKDITSQESLDEIIYRSLNEFIKTKQY